MKIREIRGPKCLPLGGPLPTCPPAGGSVLICANLWTKTTIPGREMVCGLGSAGWRIKQISNIPDMLRADGAHG